MRWVGHVAYIREMKKHTKFWSEYSNGRGHLRDLGIDERITLQFILEKWSMKVCA
jgi:hypothetical protein